MVYNIAKSCIYKQNNAKYCKIALQIKLEGVQ